MLVDIELKIQLFIASYYKQLSTDIEMYIVQLQDCKIKTGFNVMIINVYNRRKLDIIQYGTGFLIITKNRF